LKNNLVHVIKDEDVVCFLHIPRTSGTTFIAILDSFFDHNSIYPKQLWHELLNEGTKDFSKYKFFRGHFGYGIYHILDKKPLYLTMLRNPVERLISAIEYRIRDPDPRFILSNKFQGRNILEILNNPNQKYFPNLQTYHIGLEPNLYSYIDPSDPDSINYLRFSKVLRKEAKKKSDDEIIKLAKNRLEEFPFVGIQEKMKESLFLLYYTFGWKPILTTWRLNISPKRPHSEDLSPEIIDHLSKFSNLDFELHEYGKKLFEERFSQMVKDLKEKYYKTSYEKLPFDQVMHNMLEKHYEKLYSQYNPIKQDSIDYDFSTKISGSGWYYRENLPLQDHFFRWTGPETISTIDLPLETDFDLIVQFRIMHSIIPELLNNLKFKVNNHFIKIKKSTKRFGKTVFEGHISKDFLKSDKPFTRLTFEIEKTVNPHDNNPSEKTDRDIGLAFDRIKILTIEEYDINKNSIYHEPVLSKLKNLALQNQELFKKLEQ